MNNSYLSKEKSGAPKIFGFLILIFFIFVLGWNVGVNHALESSGIDSDNTIRNNNGEVEIVDMQLFWDVWRLLNIKHVDPHLMDTKEMIYGAIRGMVTSIGDPYTVFMSPKENKNFQDSLHGTLEGIGAELTLRHGLVTVISPLKNSPAKKAGLQPEDIIYKIDNESAEGLSLEEVVIRIRGKKGTAVILTVIRKNTEEPIDIKIVRNTINVESVEWKIIDDIAIVEINQFGSNTKQEFSKAINKILNSRPNGIILDLRYNGGGYLDGAIDITSEFIDKGKVVTIKKNKTEESEIIYVNGKARMSNLPLVVLINKGSASASEIVAGAVQDHERGIIIGKTSFGKGTVQEVENLIGGSSLRITIAKWFTPNDNNISEVGITPDIIVERTIEDYEEGIDPQMEKAMEELNK